MKLILVVKRKGAPDSSAWEETLDVPRMPDDGAYDYAEAIIRRFNNTLKPGESPRALVDLYEDIDAKEVIEHDWEKTNLITINDRNGLYDAYRCCKCGITGKRFGLGRNVTRDGKYSAKKYENCKE